VCCRQSLVLLKNDQRTLPFTKGRHVAVVGVVGNRSDFISGNYYSSICPGGPADFSCVPTLYAAVQQQNSGGTTTFSAGGSSVKAPADSGAIAAAVASAKAAENVILAVGIDKTVCGEGTDRSEIGLPTGQAELLAAILQLKKPTCVVLFNGGQLAVPLAKQEAPAVLEVRLHQTRVLVFYSRSRPTIALTTRGMCDLVYLLATGFLSWPVWWHGSG
jgi:beta-glucosidase